MGTNQRAQITMTDAEVTAFIDEQRTSTMATVGPTGIPHLVAMWYAVVDGKIWFETKARSQKAVNLRRDPHITCMLEDGLTYDTLRGVSIEGTAVIVEDPDDLWKVGVSVWERYNGPVHRGGEAARGVHAPQADRGAGRRRPGPVLGPPQAGHGPDPLGGTTAPK